MNTRKEVITEDDNNYVSKGVQTISTVRDQFGRITREMDITPVLKNKRRDSKPRISVRET